MSFIFLLIIENIRSSLSTLRDFKSRMRLCPKVVTGNSMKTLVDTGFYLRMSMVKKAQGAQETECLGEESFAISRAAPSGSLSTQRQNTEWPCAQCAGISLTINSFYSCCSGNTRDKVALFFPLELQQVLAGKTFTESALSQISL